MSKSRLLLVATFFARLCRCVFAFPSVYIHEPTNGSIFYLNHADITLDIVVKFQLFEVEKVESFRVCFQLDDLSAIRLTLTCFEQNTQLITLRGISPGDFTLTTVLQRTLEPKEFLADSKNFLQFRVKAFEFALPKLSFSDTVYEVVAPFQSLQAEIDIDYTIESSSISSDDFQVCVRMASKSVVLAAEGLIDNDYRKATSDRLPSTCLRSEQRHINLSRIQVGDYIIFLVAVDTKTFEVFSITEISAIVTVKPFLEVMPIIYSPHSSKDVLVIPSVGGDLVIQFDIRGLQNAVKQVKLCINITTEFTVLLPLTCLRPEERFFSLHHIPAGRHTANLALAAVSKESVVFQESLISIDIDARMAEEFIPTYDWQPLRVWHTIPSGIDTRLPLSDSAMVRKEARIPEPWRLQLSMPSPCKYFLRMDVSRSTKIDQIRIAAGKQCKISPSCFGVVADGQLLENESMVGDENYFSKRKELLFIDTSECGTSTTTMST